jgi:hypothetical protein
MLAAGAAEEEVLEAWTTVGLVVAEGVGVVLAVACGGVKAASREAVAS